jgi:predicted nucleic acid-binding protein
VVARLLAEDFPASRYLSAAETGHALAWLGELHIGGGSVYDALVAAVARQHGLPLVTRDLRAVPTYRALQVDLEILS